MRNNKDHADAFGYDVDVQEENNGKTTKHPKLKKVFKKGKTKESKTRQNAETINRTRSFLVDETGTVASTYFRISAPLLSSKMFKEIDSSK